MVSTEEAGQSHRVHIVVSGRVQGVGFRYAAVRQARRLGLLGWTRNTSDGNVEIVAEGEAERIRALIAWCHTGPPGAAVSAVRQSELPGDGRLDDFTIRW